MKRNRVLLTILAAVAVLGLMAVQGHAGVILIMGIDYGTLRKADTTYEWSSSLYAYGPGVTDSKQCKLKTPTEQLRVPKEGPDYFEDTYTYETEDAFLAVFPPGDYQWQLTGPSSARLRFEMPIPAFPPYPAITYPADGQEGVSLVPEITWEAEVDVYYYLRLYNDQGEEIYGADLGLGASSHEIPDGFLSAGSDYVVMIYGWGDLYNGGSGYAVAFTTAE